MKQQCVLVMLLLVSAMAQGQEQASFRFRFKDATSYRSEAEISIKPAVLRRRSFVTPIPKQKLEYLTLEAWFTNADIDVCTAPELADIATIPLKSDEEFVLVFQGIDYGWGGGGRGGNANIALAAMLFGEDWGKPASRAVAIEWNQGGAPKEMGAPTASFVLGASNWVVRHDGTKKKRKKEAGGRMIISREPHATRLIFHVKTGALTAIGSLPVAKFCPEIGDNKKFWMDDKIPS